MDKSPRKSGAYIFDVWARMDGDNVAMLDPQIVSHNSVDSSRAVIQIIISQDNQDCIFALLALDQHCVTSEKL
jgi:hypothetical protein